MTRRLALLTFLLLGLILKKDAVSSYKICSPEQGGGICPDNDTCCPTGTPGSSSCISSKEGDEAICCVDDGLGVTGCPHDYECQSKLMIPSNSATNGTSATNNYLRTATAKNDSDTIYSNFQHCHLADPNYNGTKPKPPILPRYQLYSPPHEVLTRVYGLPLIETSSALFPVIDSTNQFSVSSSQGALISDDKFQNIHDKFHNNNKIVNVAYFSSMGSLDSNHPLDLQKHQRVTTVFIVIHGSGRTAEDYLYGAMSSLPNNQKDPSNSTIMVLSPWFLDPDDDKDEEKGDFEFVQENLTDPERQLNATTERRHHHKDHNVSVPVPLPPNTLRWIEVGPGLSHTWRYGANAINSSVSSFTAVDRMVERLVQDPIRFPSLKRILVAGHSAGGQFVHRWALLSNSPVWNEPRAEPATLQNNQHLVGYEDSQHFEQQQQQPPQRSVQIRVIPANPRCFAYLDDRRFVEDRETNQTTFQRPSESVMASCPSYNEWIWGLDAGGNVSAPYKDQAIADAGGPRSIALRYVTQRHVVYLAGGEDLEVFEDDCGSVIQGPTRRERSRHFMDSLHELFPEEMRKNGALHKRLLAPGVPHDHTLMFQSPQGQHALFGEDVQDDNDALDQI